MIKDLILLRRGRKISKKQRKETGICQNCGKKKCEDWCYGPVFRQYLWAMIKIHKKSTCKFLWFLYKSNLKWAGVEDWHRYE